MDVALVKEPNKKGQDSRMRVSSTHEKLLPSLSFVALVPVAIQVQP